MYEIIHTSHGNHAANDVNWPRFLFFRICGQFRVNIYLSLFVDCDDTERILALSPLATRNEPTSKKKRGDNKP